MNGTALVLSGGGAKGAYEIGVWKALIELDLVRNITAVSGTSIGALNGALFVDGDYDKAANLWETLTSEKVLKPNILPFIKCLYSLVPGISKKRDLLSSGLLCFSDLGLFSSNVLKNIIYKTIDLNQISLSRMHFYVTCTEFPQMKAVYFKLNKQSHSHIRKVLMASAALPVIFDDVDINKKNYYDGGLVDNTPIKPLYDLGYRKFIVVLLGKKNGFNTEKFPDGEFTIIAPQKRLGGFFKGTLNFDPELSVKNMALGYDDAINVLVTQKKVRSLLWRKSI